MSASLPTAFRGYEKMLGSFLAGRISMIPMGRTFSSVVRRSALTADVHPTCSFNTCSDELTLQNMKHRSQSATIFISSRMNQSMHAKTSIKMANQTRMASSATNVPDNAVGNNVLEAMEALRKADAVCFDVDSTVITEEGIDVLADSLGKGAEVAAWTAKAMEGGVKFEDALAARLDIIKPSRSSIEQCLVDHPLVLSKGVEDLIKALQNRGTHVYLVSGGFRLMIEPVATHLDIPKDNIYANTIWFDSDGNYTGFDANEPTSADGGKPKALRLIESKGKYNDMVMVGDGATDAQAKPPAKAFIGFGGVIVRDSVKQKACWYVTDFDHMISIVKNNS